MRGLQATGMVDEHPRSGRPHKTTPRGDIVVDRFTRKHRFATSVRVRDELNF